VAFLVGVTTLVGDGDVTAVLSALLADVVVVLGIPPPAAAAAATPLVLLFVMVIVVVLVAAATVVVDAAERVVIVPPTAPAPLRAVVAIGHVAAAVVAPSGLQVCLCPP
jgi:hypothetical protein